MLPISFKEANFTFMKPESMTDEQCSDLCVFKGHTDDNTPITYNQTGIDRRGPANPN